MWSPGLLFENYSLRATGSQIHSKRVTYAGNLGIELFSNYSIYIHITYHISIKECKMNSINSANLARQEFPLDDNIQNNITDITVDSDKITYYKDLDNKQYSQIPAIGRSVVRVDSYNELVRIMSSESDEPPRKKHAFDRSVTDNASDNTQYKIFMQNMSIQDKQKARVYSFTCQGTSPREIIRLQEAEGWGKLEIGSIFKAQNSYNSKSYDHYGVYIGVGKIIHLGLSHLNKETPSVIIQNVSAFLSEMENVNRDNITVINKPEGSLPKHIILHNALNAHNTTNSNFNVYNEQIAKTIVYGSSSITCSTVNTCHRSEKTIQTMINYDKGIEYDKQKDSGDSHKIVNSDKKPIKDSTDHSISKNKCTIQ